MIAYGMAKAAVHHLVKSCAGPDSGIPAGGNVVGILPVMLDTPMNRKFMGGADTSTWTPLDHLSTEIIEWAHGTKRVENGQLFKVVTEHHKTKFMLVK
jgi:dihydropteridine reductase